MVVSNNHTAVVFVLIDYIVFNGPFSTWSASYFVYVLLCSLPRCFCHPAFVVLPLCVLRLLEKAYVVVLLELVASGI